MRLHLTAALLSCVFSAASLAAADSPDPLSTYVLGPDDQLVIRVLDLDEVDGKPIRVDMRGNIHVPLAGRVHASGLTIEQLEAELVTRFKAYVHDPVVTAGIAEFRSQPVSVLGAVKNPGVHQILGNKSLFEILSLAGGLSPDAGNIVNITRRKERGSIPLPTARPDATGEFIIADVGVKSILDAKNPEQNIVIQPDDVISVPRGDMVYVIGSVRRSGGFMLNEKEAISVLQALSMAEGLERTAAPGNAKILRPAAALDNRIEIPVDLKKILAGKAQDVALRANDILFIPTSATKNIALRSLEAAISMGTGVVIYRR